MDTGGAGDGTRDVPMAMAMEMRTVVTLIAADTASTAALEPTERNKNGKRRKRSEAPVAALGPGDWRSQKQRTAQQHAHELAQLHRTITKMVSVLETQTALQEAQW
jgi:hypothetical protein